MTSPAGRILYVVTLISRTARYGGPTEVALAQSAIARELGFDALVVGGTTRGDEPLEASSVSTFTIRRWLPLPGFAGFFSCAAVRKVWRVVADCEVVHIAFAREAVPVYSAFVCMVRSVPFVIQPHGMLTSRTSRLHRCADLVARPLVARADAVVAFNASEASAHEQRLGARSGHVPIVTIPNPPEEQTGALEAVQNLDGDPQILFAARLHPRKCVGDFLDAAALSARRGFLATYVVAGPDQGDLALVQHALAVSTNIQYLGALSRDELHAQIRRSACVVVPSRAEPWGQVLVAAMRYGVPVVVAQSAALAHDVEEANAGIAVPDGDPQAIADAVERWTALAREGKFVPNRDLIELRFSAAPATQGLGALYRELRSS